MDVRGYCVVVNPDGYYPATRFDLWVNIELIGPLLLDCFIDNMRLEYNNVTRKSASPKGVQIRFPGFGNTTNMDYLDPRYVCSHIRVCFLIF